MSHNVDFKRIFYEYLFYGAFSYFSDIL